MDVLKTLDTLQDAMLDNKTSKKTSQYKFDKLRMYFSEDFTYNGISVRQPTIGEILNIGESDFYKSFSPFLYNSTSIRVFLWDNGIDWNKTKDIEVFSILSQSLDNFEILNRYFNISFDDMKLLKVNPKDDSKDSFFVLYSESQNIAIDEDDYMVIAEYLRTLFNYHPKIERAKGKTAKSWIIQEDKLNATNDEINGDSTLLSLVSTLLNHPGFKYKLDEIREMGIYQFMDSVERIKKYENGIAALRGIYSGFCDAKSIPEDTFNFMGEI